MTTRTFAPALALLAWGALAVGSAPTSAYLLDVPDRSRYAAEVRPASRRHASIQLTLDCYSHWMPTMGRNTADGMDEALG
jgi:hypothetical protein